MELGETNRRIKLKEMWRVLSVGMFISALNTEKVAEWRRFCDKNYQKASCSS